MGKIKCIGEIVLRTIYPQTCPVCGRVLDGDLLSIYIETKAPAAKLGSHSRLICEPCRKKLRLIETKSFKDGKVLFKYEEDMRNILFKLKYAHAAQNADFLGSAMAYHFSDYIKAYDFDAIVPVPLHPARQRTRGYNQAELIAKAVSKHVGVPIRNDIVLRTANTKALKDMNPVQRKNNLKNAFKTTQNVVKLKKILLVDDIITTKSTIDEIKTYLVRSGVETVRFLAVSAREDEEEKKRGGTDYGSKEL